jgi:predicted enzyme related to lactoylglutathione lyase
MDKTTIPDLPLLSPGAPSFIEIGVPSSATASAFYGSLFGWRFHPYPQAEDSFWVETPTLRLGVHPGDEDRNMVVYFAVENIESAMARVRELGGTTAEPSPETPGFGRFVECKDPQGVRFGLHQAPAGT